MQNELEACIASKNYSMPAQHYNHISVLWEFSFLTKFEVDEAIYYWPVRQFCCIAQPCDI